MRDLDDSQLVLLVQATGDVRAYDELARRHQPALFGFLGSVGADAALIDDAMQRALLKAFEKIGSFEGRASFRTWLFKIAYRELGMLRRRRRDGPPVDATEPVPSGISSDPANVELALDLNAALAHLAPDERTAVIMCDAYGFSNREAAEAMAKPLGTIKTYVRRGRAHLRLLLSAEVTDD